MLWYHDHTLGINRLNVYAGLMGACIIRDKFEDGLNLPKGKHEIPLILYDRSFDSDGQLSYEVAPDADAPWVPEMFGDGFLVNGKLLDKIRYETPGTKHFEKAVPPDWLSADADTTIGMSVDKLYVAPKDGVRFGVILVRMGFKQ